MMKMRRGNLSRRGVIFCSILWLIVVPLLNGACRPLFKKKPLGVVVIVLDSARADHMGTYGYPKTTTPGIDQIARESIVFENAYSVACNTYPSVTSLWTGLHLIHHGVVSDGSFNAPVLPKGTPTLPQLLHLRRIATALFSANPNVSARQGFTRVVDHFKYFQLKGRTPAPFKLLHAAYRWITRQRRPFFVYIHLMQPHTPYLPPYRYGQLFSHQPPPRVFGLDGFIYRVRTGKIVPTPEQIEAMRFWYDANLRWVDEAVFQFYRALQRANFTDSIWFVITADHGEAFGEHGEFYHLSSVYEENIHVPLIIHPPRWARPFVGRYRAYVYMQDLHPTILSWFRVKPPDWIDFHPLIDRWKHPHQYGWREQISCVPQFRACALRRLEWKAIIHRSSELTRWLPLLELYHLPDETWLDGNLAPEMPERARNMLHLYHQWMATGSFSPLITSLDSERRDLMALGYLAPWSRPEKFWVAPRWLMREDLQGEVEGYRFAYDPDTGKVLVLFDIRNMSRTIWPAFSLHHRGRVLVQLLNQHGEVRFQGGTRVDVSPQHSGTFRIPLSIEELKELGDAVRIRLTQEGGTVSRELEWKERSLVIRPFVYPGPRWSNERLDDDRVFHWLTGTEGSIYLIIPSVRSSCYRFEAHMASFARVRRAQMMDPDTGRILATFRLVPHRLRRVIQTFHVNRGPVILKWVVRSLDGADSPFDILHTSDVRLLSLRIFKPRLAPCSSAIGR